MTRTSVGVLLAGVLSLLIACAGTTDLPPSPVVTQDAGGAAPTPPPAPAPPVPSPTPGPAPNPSPAPVPTPSPVPAPNPLPDPPFPTADPGPCPASVDPGSVHVKASGEAVSFQVVAPADCRWSVSTGMSWIALEMRSGIGSGRGAFVVAPNDGFARSGSISIGARTISVSQDPAPAPVASPCPASVEPASVHVKASGEAVTFGVSASADCRWSVSTGTSWIRITAPSGTGSATGTFLVSANDGPSRSGSVDVGGRTISVSQDAPPPPCPASVDPGSVRVKASGETVAFTVSASADCTWSVSTGMSWIALATRSGIGSGRGAFAVAANDGFARSGTVSIGGQTISVSQDPVPPPPCPAAVDPRAVRLTAAAQEVVFSVTASADCKWSVTGTDVPWIGIPTGSVAGSGSSRFGVKANDGSTVRSGSVKIGGLVIAVTQDPPRVDPPPSTTCIAKLNPESVSFPAIGGTFKFTVTLQNGCRWVIEKAPTWVHVTPTSGAGTTDVSVVVDRNLERLGRTEPVVVNGRTITVSQAGAVLLR